MNLPTVEHSSATAPPKRSTRLWGVAIPGRWTAALGIATLLALVALTTYSGVTTDRFAAVLAITRWVQKFEVNEGLEKTLFYVIFEGLAGVVVLLTVTWLWFRSGHRVDAVVLVLAKLPNFINFPLRALYGRPRPDETIVNVIGSPAGQSFPSGQAVLVVLLYGFLFYMLLRYTRSRRLIYAALAAIVLYVPFTGLYLVHYGRHWGSDVIGGYLYGLLYLAMAIGLFHLGRAWERRHPDTLTMATVRRLSGKLGVGGGDRVAR